MKEIRQFRDFIKGEAIVVGCDPGTGEKNYSCAQFLSRKKLDVPLIYHTEKLATEMTNALYPILEQIYDITGVEPLVAYERGNGGIFELTRLEGFNRRAKYKIFEMPGKDHIGWDTNTATRPKMLSEIKEAIDKRLIAVYDQVTIEEMLAFIISKTGKAKAEKGAVDDAVMALAIAWQLHVCTPLETDNSAIYNNAPRPVGGYGG